MTVGKGFETTATERAGDHQVGADILDRFGQHEHTKSSHAPFLWCVCALRVHFQFK